jgi:hypothetical protein
MHEKGGEVPICFQVRLLTAQLEWHCGVEVNAPEIRNRAFIARILMRGEDSVIKC